MKALDRALINVYSLLIVTIPLIEFGHNALCIFLGRDPYFGRTGVCRWSAMDRALVVPLDCQ